MGLGLIGCPRPAVCPAAGEAGEARRGAARLPTPCSLDHASLSVSLSLSLSLCHSVYLSRLSTSLPPLSPSLPPSFPFLPPSLPPSFPTLCSRLSHPSSLSLIIYLSIYQSINQFIYLSIYRSLFLLFSIFIQCQFLLVPLFLCKLEVCESLFFSLTSVPCVPVPPHSVEWRSECIKLLCCINAQWSTIFQHSTSFHSSQENFDFNNIINNIITIGPSQYGIASG